MARKEFKSKVFEHNFTKDGPSYYITENENGVKVHFLEGESELANKTISAQIIKKFDTGYTIIKAAGRTFDYLNNQDDKENDGKLGELEEVYQMQTTGDVVTKRVENKSVEAAKKTTYAFVNGKKRENLKSGERTEIDDKAFEKFKNAYEKYNDGMNLADNRASSDFKDYVDKFMGDYRFKDMKPYIDSLHYPKANNVANSEILLEQDSASNKGYTVLKNQENGKSYLSTKGSDNESGVMEILAHKKRSGGFLTVRANNEYYDMWLHSRRLGNGLAKSHEEQELDDDVNFLVNPSGEMFGITQNERAQIVDKSIEINDKLSKDKKQVENTQLEFVENNLPQKASITQKI